MHDLSVIIPARNEEFLQRTIEDVLSHIELDTEVIAICDGYWPDPPIKDHDRVTVLHPSKSIGQRAAVNWGVAISRAEFVMKLDGHCSVDQGFDRKLIEPYRDGRLSEDTTTIPQMYNLHAFDWECMTCGNRIYQGPYPHECNKCGIKIEIKNERDQDFEKIIVWKRRMKRHTEFWMFDNELKFQYWHDYKKRPEAKGDIVDVMSSIGACFLMPRKRFFEIDGLDENHGKWGQFGTEIACKSWLSGGRHVVNKNTWFAHMFRTNKDGFSFPYPLSGKAVQRARDYSKDMWLNNKWPKQTRELSWLINKFAPVPTWEKTVIEYRKIVKNGFELSADAKPLLSILIPARNEVYLQATIDDIIKNFKTDFEIIVGLDDCDIDIREHSRIRIFRSDKRIGMRPIINRLVSMANGRFIMKTDAHCSFDEGYDNKLIMRHQKGYTLLGIRYELDVNKWERKERTNCDFRYLSNPDVDELGGLRGLPWHEWKKITKGQKLAESMSLSGSGWLMEKTQFDAWGGLDENHGTFAQEGCEIACKTWLSGGRLLINRDTWYAHWNRGKAPYALSTKHREKSIKYSEQLWLNDLWPLQKYSFNWLLEHFNPVPGWNLEIKEIKAKKQGTRFKGSRVKYRNEHHDHSVEELWENRIGISEPLKRWRLKIFFDSFYNVILQIDAGRAEFNDNDIVKTQYFNYLFTHLSKTALPQDKKELLKKYKKRLLRKFKTGIDLYHSVKQSGLKTPLEFYRKDGKWYLWKGYRRLVILKVLGIKEVPIITHIDDKCKQLPKHFVKIEKGSIDELGQKQFQEYGGKSTDKYWTHRYTPIYDKAIGHLRNKKIKILELGVARGASLKLWYDAFPKAQIYGLDKNEDIWKEMTPESDRVKVFVGKQQDKAFLSKVSKSGPFDIIIDDCGHNPDQQLVSFRELWESLKPHGFYIIEDCYVSYLDRNKGRVNIPQELSKLVDSIYKDFKVLSVQFYYNICVIQKGIE